MKKLLLIGFIFILSVNLYSQWVQQNPFPTQNDLNYVKFFSQNSGIILGNYGTILKTSNQGINWIVQDNSFNYSFINTYFIDSETGWSMGYERFYKTSDGGKSWSSQNIGYFFSDIKFINAQTGYGVNTNGLYRTINSGSSWALILANYSLKCVFFVNQQTGWVAGDAGKILKTTDSGINWDLQNSNVSSGSLIRSYFSDSLTGCIICTTGNCYITTNGGNNWLYQTIGTVSLNSVFFVNQQTGWIAGNGVVFRTTNSGIFWDYTDLTKNIKSIFFTDMNCGIAVGQDGSIYKSNNGGLNWTNYNSTFISDNLLQIRFTDAYTGYILCQSENLLKTTNSGLNWFSTGLFEYPSAYILFVNSNTGWQVGDYGRILKSTNGGINWLTQVSGTNNNLYSASFINDQTGWVAGGSWSLGGVIIKTTNGGLNWISLTYPSNYLTYAIDFVNSQTGWIAGLNGIMYKTTNGGLNWLSQITEPISLHSIFFINPQTGWVSGDDGILIRTTNAGDNWISVVVDVTTSTLNSIFFINYNTGWVVGNTGLLFRSTNGGINWTIQNSLNYKNNYSVFFLNQFTGFVVGEKGKIIKTTNGGSVFVSQTGSQVSSDFSLSQNYPNPFNPYTNIRYQIPDNRFVTLKIFDILGKEIETVVKEKQSAGTYEVRWDGSNYPSGVYFYRLEARDFTETRKMVLVK